MVPPHNEYSSRLPAKLADGEQASYSIPLGDFRKNSLPHFQRKPKFLSFLWSRFIFIQIIITTGDSFTFRIHKNLRDEITGKARAR
jgi:hypothetical protein